MVNGKFIQIKNQQNTLLLPDISNCLYLFGTGTIIPTYSAKKNRGLHGRQLLCTFLTDNFNGRFVSSASQYALTIVNFWHQRVNKLPTHFRPTQPLSRHRTRVRIIKDLTIKVVLVLFKSNLLYFKIFNKTFEICYILLSHCCKNRMLFCLYYVFTRM